MVIKVRVRNHPLGAMARGPNVRAQFFVGPAEGQLQLAGEVVLRTDEVEDFAARMLMAGCLVEERRDD